MVIAAERIRTLNKYEKSILNSLERGMKRYDWIPLEQIKNATKLVAESEINYRLARLIKWGMVRFNPVPYDGYSLVFGGYDTLALSTLTQNGTISALGSPIGEGKENTHCLRSARACAGSHQVSPRRATLIFLGPSQPRLYARGRALPMVACVPEISRT